MENSVKSHGQMPLHLVYQKIQLCPWAEHFKSPPSVGPKDMAASQSPKAGSLIDWDNAVPDMIFWWAKSTEIEFGIGEVNGKLPCPFRLFLSNIKYLKWTLERCWTTFNLQSASFNKILQSRNSAINLWVMPITFLASERAAYSRAAQIF